MSGDAERGDLEETVVRGREEDDHTAVFGRRQAGVDDSTVLTERSGDQEAVDENTVVVGREVDDSTVISGRRGTTDSEATVAIERGARSSVSGRHGEALVVKGSIAGGRRNPRPAPVDPRFVRRAHPAAGPGALDSYPARPLPQPDARPTDLGQGPAATRDTATVLPSVRRRSRRHARFGLALVVLVCAVSVAGLVALALAVWG